MIFHIDISLSFPIQASLTWSIDVDSHGLTGSLIRLLPIAVCSACNISPTPSETSQRPGTARAKGFQEMLDLIMLIVFG